MSLPIAKFHVKGLFEIPDRRLFDPNRRLFVMAGTVVAGDIRAGMWVHIQKSPTSVMVSPIHSIGLSCPDGVKDICLCFRGWSKDSLQSLDVRDKTLDVTADGMPEWDPADLIDIESVAKSEHDYREKARQAAKAAAKARWSGRKTILAKVKGYFADERQRAEAVEITRRHFDKTMGSRVRVDEPVIFYEDESGFVVRVYHGFDKPTSRAWFKVSRMTGEIQELSFSEVIQYGESQLLA